MDPDEVVLKTSPGGYEKNETDVPSSEEVGEVEGGGPPEYSPEFRKQVDDVFRYFEEKISAGGNFECRICDWRMTPNCVMISDYQFQIQNHVWGHADRKPHFCLLCPLAVLDIASHFDEVHFGEAGPVSHYNYIDQGSQFEKEFLAVLNLAFLPASPSPSSSSPSSEEGESADSDESDILDLMLGPDERKRKAPVSTTQLHYSESGPTHSFSREIENRFEKARKKEMEVKAEIRLKVLKRKMAKIKDSSIYAPPRINPDSMWTILYGYSEAFKIKFRTHYSKIFMAVKRGERIQCDIASCEWETDETQKKQLHRGCLKHVEQHLDVPHFECKRCKKVFKSIHLARLHIKKHPDSPPPKPIYPDFEDCFYNFRSVISPKLIEVLDLAFPLADSSNNPAAEEMSTHEAQSLFNPEALLQDLETFAATFKDRRTELGLTQREVADAVALSQTTVSRFESQALPRSNMIQTKTVLEPWLMKADAAKREGKPLPLSSHGEQSLEVLLKVGKAKRTVFGDEEKTKLEKLFRLSGGRPSATHVAEMATLIGVTVEVVRVWFNNRRQKEDRKRRTVQLGFIE